jgi:integrase
MGVQRRGESWRARYRHPETAREYQQTFERKLEAQRWLREQLAAVDGGAWVDPRAGRITFTAYFTDWSRRQVWTSGTHKAMGLAVRSATFSDLELNKIRTSHVEGWVKQMSQTLAPSTIHTRVTNVRGVFRAAVRDRVIAVDPSAGVRLPRLRKREAQMRIPTPAEVRALLETADERFRPLIAVCAFAGLRLGEAAALQLGDVDFLRRTIAVRRQVQRENGGTVEIRLPKYGSERDVFAPDDLLTMLAELVEAGIREPWLFSGAEADPPHQNTIGHRWRQTCRRAAVQRVKLHDLRHFYASGLIASGCDVVTVQRALGHAKPSTTLNTYMHLWPTAEDRTRAGAASMMSEVLDPGAGRERAGRQL